MRIQSVVGKSCSECGYVGIVIGWMREDECVGVDVKVGVVRDEGVCMCVNECCCGHVCVHRCS